MKRRLVVISVCIITFMLLPIMGFAADKSAAMQRLYEAAKKEGELVIHDGGTIESITPICKAFEARFPGIKVKTIVQPSPTIIQRIIVEAQTKKLSIDAASGDVTIILALMERNLIKKLDLSDVVDIDPSNVWGDGILHVEASTVPVLVYNTNKVAPSDVPKTWEDLLDPKWKGGKIYLCKFGLFFSALFFERGEDAATEYLKKFKKQGIVIKTDPRTTTADVSSGEAYIGEAFPRAAIVNKQSGAPIDIVPVGPVCYMSDGTYVVNGAPHPNAAKLWTAWRQSEEGKAMTLKYEGSAPEIKCANGPSAQWICDAGLNFRVLESIKDCKQMLEYMAMVRDILGLMPKK